MKFFIAAITKHVIERHLVRPLAKVMSSRILARLTEDEIRFVAGEDEDTVQTREYLTDRRETLIHGRTAFRNTLGQMQ